MIAYICMRDGARYNGRVYKKGQSWIPADGGLPPTMGLDWVIRGEPDSDLRPLRPAPEWVPTPAIPTASIQKRPARKPMRPFTPEQLAVLAVDPYANVDDLDEPKEPDEADPPPARHEKTTGLTRPIAP